MMCFVYVYIFPLQTLNKYNYAAQYWIVQFYEMLYCGLHDLLTCQDTFHVLLMVCTNSSNEHKVAACLHAFEIMPRMGNCHAIICSGLVRCSVFVC